MGVYIGTVFHGDISSGNDIMICGVHKWVSEFPYIPLYHWGN